MRKFFSLVFLAVLASVGWSFLAGEIWQDQCAQVLWPWIILFFVLLNSALFLLVRFKNTADTAINNIMTVSVVRLIASGGAFALLQALNDGSGKSVIIHFIPHYFIFSIMEFVARIKQKQLPNKNAN
jgi:hypothetical protein